MADPFEAELEAMFDAPPAFADDAAFTLAVDRRLRRLWLVRRTALGVAGAVGGAVALSRLPDLRLPDMPAAPAWFDGLAMLAQPYGGAGVLWMVAGMVAAAAVLLRRVEV